jgi:hypothetical protein
MKHIIRRIIDRSCVRRNCSALRAAVGRGTEVIAADSAHACGARFGSSLLNKPKCWQHSSEKNGNPVGDDKLRIGPARPRPAGPSGAELPRERQIEIVLGADGWSDRRFIGIDPMLIAVFPGCPTKSEGYACE